MNANPIIEIRSKTYIVGKPRYPNDRLRVIWDCTLNYLGISHRITLSGYFDPEYLKEDLREDAFEIQAISPLLKSPENPRGEMYFSSLDMPLALRRVLGKTLFNPECVLYKFVDGEVPNSRDSCYS